jgi:hypothetical protein
MAQSYVPQLATALPPSDAAEIILDRNPRHFDLECERFFSTHWTDLPHRQVYLWLTRTAPEDAPSRPLNQIIARLVDWLLTQAAQDPFSAVNFPGAIASIQDKWARDAFVEALRARLPQQEWELLLPLAAGCREFSLITNFELRTHSPRHEPPRGLIPNGPLPRFRAELFDDRREPNKCIAHLRALALDPEAGAYVLWVLRELDLLTKVVSPEALLATQLALKELEGKERDRARYHLDLADDLSNAPTFKATVMKRIVDASARGVPWGYLWWEIPEALRDDIGIASIDTSAPAPWAVGSILRTLAGSAAWHRMFDRFDGPRVPWSEHEAFHAGAGLRHPALFRGAPERVKDFWDMELDGGNWFMTEPPPEDADDAFEERLSKRLHRLCHGDVLTIANRLADLPLTAARARRIVEMTAPSGDFFHLKKCEDIAKACGAFPDIARPQRWDARILRAYAVLTGDDRSISKWFAESLAARDFWTALSLAEHDESLRTPERVEALQSLIPDDGLRALVRLQDKQGWLVSEQDVIQRATNGEFRDDEWTWKDPPTYMRPVLEAKAATTPNPQLAGELLERLKQMGAGPHQLARIATERISRGGVSTLSEHRVAAMLTSGKLWEEWGRRIAARVLREDGQAGAQWLGGAGWDVARSSPSVLPTVHAVVADVLIDIAEERLRRADVQGATQPLRALARLTAPPRLFSRVRALRELSKAPPVVVLLDANEGLMRRADDESATIGSFLDAMKVMASGPEDADSDDEDGGDS